MKLQLTPKSKIINPIDNAQNIYSFEGEFNKDMFFGESPQAQYLKSQKENLEQVISILEAKNLILEYIWMGTFNNDSGYKANNFVIRTNSNHDGLQIYWRKYATFSPGSGQNWIYTIKEDSCEKIQLSRWLYNHKLTEV